MRRLADRLGMRAPPSTNTCRTRPLSRSRSWPTASPKRARLRRAGPELEPVARAYREWALAHPHLFRLMNDRPLPRDRLPTGLEARAAEPVLGALGDPHRARAAWAAAHGLASLELAGRFPADADVDAAWAAMVRAFAP